MPFLPHRFYLQQQYFIGMLLVGLTSLLSFFLINFITYKAVALVLLLVVSINAILLDIFPVILSALVSALIWNFFFIPPTFTFYIGTPEDALMFAMYFVIASINAVLTHKIRQIEYKAQTKEAKIKSLNLYDTLFNSLSHELKTPISTIIGAIDAIKVQQTKLSSSQKEELYSAIELAVLRLDRQVSNLLSMSRLEAGFVQPKTDWTDLNEIIFKVIQFIEEEAKERQIIFNSKETLPLFKLDSGLIEQVVYNILHNAIQYTPLNTQIEIVLDKYPYGALLSIADNGPGFPAEQITYVFDKFYRLTNTSVGGTGLGLSIVKGFVEAMNGKITLDNRPEGGAIFRIELPCEISQHNDLEHE